MIGILGGMGAAAGVYFLDTLVKECQRRGCKKDTDFPEFVLYSMTTKGITEAGVVDERALRRDLIRGLNVLNACGVDVIAVACNSAHLLFDFVKIHSDAKVMNMIECTLDVVGNRKYGLISTRSTRNLGLYKNGITVSDERQQQLEEAIDHATIGDVREIDRQNARDAVKELFEMGVEVIVVGCTELPLVVDKGENIIDAGECVIKKVCDLEKI